MSYSDFKPEAEQVAPDPQPQEDLRTFVNGESALQAREIRYLDDDTFRLSLEEVVTVHDRLLAKLAE